MRPRQKNDEKEKVDLLDADTDKAVKTLIKMFLAAFGGLTVGLTELIDHREDKYDIVLSALVNFTAGMAFKLGMDKKQLIHILDRMFDEFSREHAE